MALLASEYLVAILNRENGADEGPVLGDFLSAAYDLGTNIGVDFEDLSAFQQHEILQSLVALNDFNEGRTSTPACD